MIEIQVTQQQYDEAQVELAKTDGVVLTLNGPNSNISHIQSPQIDADVMYIAGKLVISNIKKHGIYKFASENSIKTHFEEMIGALKCSATQAPVPNSTDAKS